MPRKFDFISPGILLNEVDESVLPAVTKDEGPLLIGRAITGPSMQPVRVSNLEDFYAIFGRPVTGKGAINSDVWRDGNLVAPTYAMFAAQAHLASNTTPITFMRLAGEQDDNASSDGKAGWTLNTTVVPGAAASNSCAFGLFVAPSASSGKHTGSLCAVFYTDGGAMALSGTNAASSYTGYATAELMKYDAGDDLKIVFYDGSDETVRDINFNDGSQNYIRNKINTNPQKLESTTNFNKDGSNDKFFLGETFDVAYADADDGSDKLAVMVPLQGITPANGWGNRVMEAKKASTGWFVNRKQDGNRAELFKLHAHAAGEYMSANYWINIEDLKMGTTLNPNSSFTLKIMKNGTAVETYTGCNLNPSSENYISKKIGDQYQVWNKTEKKNNVRGMYPNRSDYFYVEVHSDVENQTISDSLCLPIGFQMPAKHADVAIADNDADTSLDTDVMFLGGSKVPLTQNAAVGQLIGGWDGAGAEALFQFPSIKLTTSGSNNGADYEPTSVFGLRHMTDDGTQWNASYADVVRPAPASNAFASPGDFSLEDVSGSATTGLYHYNSGSDTYVGLLTGSVGAFGLGIRKFAAPVVGGFDGVNIFHTDPFASRLVGTGRLNSYERYTLEKALDICADSEVTEYDLLSIPGQTNTAITNRVISICETRGDALAIIDLAKIYLNPWESDGTADHPTVTEAVDEAQQRNINSSYAATYYPSVRMLDTSAGNRDVIVVPPSVAAIGAIARSQALSEPWFAPAGFNRGGINELGGLQGPRVIGTLEHLSKANRDSLYEENLNPIARFPASGDIVIFGQKTMQQLPSALDRINVRRLLLYIKRRIGKISETILFDNNVQATWNRFKSQADIVLSDVQARLGIVEYKLVLDETTTTADLVDRNILYAKVLIKPARAIEFIVVDFVVTRSGIEL